MRKSFDKCLETSRVSPMLKNHFEGDGILRKRYSITLSYRDNSKSKVLSS
jgi:hypothetical protein